eukprot:4469233-Pleurochrysis_carterae.AAC.1
MYASPALYDERTSGPLKTYLRHGRARARGGEVGVEGSTGSLSVEATRTAARQRWRDVEVEWSFGGVAWPERRVL